MQTPAALRGSKGMWTQRKLDTLGLREHLNKSIGKRKQPVAKVRGQRCALSAGCADGELYHHRQRLVGGGVPRTGVRRAGNFGSLRYICEISNGRRKQNERNKVWVAGSGEATRAYGECLWRQVPRKDAVHCEKLRGGVCSRLSRRCPNGETHVGACPRTAR